MESGNVSGTDIGRDLKTHQAATPSESNHFSQDKKFRSSSHSSSSSGEVVQLDENSAEGIPVSSMQNPNTEQSNDGSATSIPPTQATERPAEQASPSADSDRIPSHVFARTSTARPMEWSVASNESLFSIHTGNMSFTTDQLSWMSKSGELGYTSDSTFSVPLTDIPSNYSQTPSRKSNEITSKSGNMNEDRYGVTEEAAAETMKEVLRENECQNKDNIAKETSHFRSMSQQSDGSVKSFAFPILTGDADKSSSLRKSTKNKNQVSRPSTLKETPETPTEAPKTQTPPETPKPQSPLEALKPETPKSETPKATRNAGPKKCSAVFLPVVICSIE
ncbi:hypothetical protein DITRI_Ditri04bG0040300 [Diplodiscus trichospermus]